MDFVDEAYISSLIDEQKTHLEISEILKRSYPNTRGLSERSVRRYCKAKDFTSRIKQSKIDEAVSRAVEKVGPTYGRKMMKGYVSYNDGLKVSQKRIAVSLRTVAPIYHQQRQTDTARKTNPIPYRADYFGHKLHIDQNEKLAMYGVTHVVAIDGHSRYVTAGATMYIKNNIIIYDKVYRKSVIEFGLIDQVRVDHGREFFLMLGIQEYLSHLRTNQTISCYRQTQSKKNLPIERFWCEVNNRINYPLKSILVNMDNNQQFNMDDNIDRFCVSWVARNVAEYGLQNTCIPSWNHHPIAGRGVPLIIRQATNNRIKQVANNAVPSSDEAIMIYRDVYNGRLNESTSYGVDPLANHLELFQSRSNGVNSLYTFENIFSSVVNNNSYQMEQAVLYFLSETRRLMQSI